MEGDISKSYILQQIKKLADEKGTSEKLDAIIEARIQEWWKAFHHIRKREVS
jgi:hypothetical protein